MAKDLRNEAIQYLASFGKNDIDVRNIKTKFGNISSKTGRYNVPNELFLKRVSRNSRALMPYRTLMRNKITKEQLNSFENGVIVEFVNNDYFGNQTDDLTIWLKTLLGSDSNVASIITIKSEGDSSSSVQRDAYQKLLNKFGEKGIKDNILKRSDEYNSSKGNDQWKGYIYYSIKGGQQDTFLSHIKGVNLFNPAVEYASTKVSLHIDYVMIYFALHSVEYSNERDNLISSVARELEAAEYDQCNLLDYCDSHISLTLNKGKLMDPIQATEINILDFALTTGDNSLDITHDESVNKDVFSYDNKMQTILSPANPRNLFWSKHLSNMMQQNFSLDEFFSLQEKIVARRKLLENSI